MKNGIQVSSLKPLLLNEAQTAEAFQKMRALGCNTVQLQWIDPSVPIPAIAWALENSGITSVSVQDFYETVLADFDYYKDLNAATGGTWLCVSRIPERLKSREGLDVFIAELRAMQDKLTPLGQKLCLHPVSADFTAVPGMNAVEYLFDHMPEMDICLDLYHLNRNCAHMPGFIRRYAGRICMVHIKDAIGDTLVPAGQGDTNWNGVVKACLDADVPYGFVEQERWEKDPYVCLKEAMDWLDEEIQKASTTTYQYITLREAPERMPSAAQWFHSKWGVPEEAYLECMEAYLRGETEYGWYLCLDEEQIIGGLGVIENDFHDRKDLTPNVCAVYTEETHRCQGIAGRLLNMAVEDLRTKDISPVYLVTDHTGFYEKYGWEFLCMVQGDGEPEMTRMYIHR